MTNRVFDDPEPQRFKNWSVYTLATARLYTKRLKASVSRVALAYNLGLPTSVIESSLDLIGGEIDLLVSQVVLETTTLALKVPYSTN